jgi:hypothetical protein
MPNHRSQRKIMRNRSHQAVIRFRRLVGELDYAQRRLFELRTGVPATGASRRRRDEHQIQMLEDLYRRGWRH